MILAGLVSGALHGQPIDRRTVVSRHDITLTQFDGERPLQVGNGHFAIGLDVTGLQTFALFNTMSDWGWNSTPVPSGLHLSDYKGQVWDTHGRPIRYPMPDPDQPVLSDYLAGNPHRVNLARLGFEFHKANGLVAQPTDIKAIRQTLQLWKGEVVSEFEVDGVPVTVTTLCGSSSDTVAVKVASPLIEAGRLKVVLEAPADNGAQFANFVGNLGRPDAWLPSGPAEPHSARFVHHLDSLSTYARLDWSGAASLGQSVAKPPRVLSAKYGCEGHFMDVTAAANKWLAKGRTLTASNDLGGDPALGKPKVMEVTFKDASGQTQTVTVPENGGLEVPPFNERPRVTLAPSGAAPFEFCLSLSPRAALAPSQFEQVQKDSEKGWEAYWREGGFVDFSGSTDPRWQELERRVILSQYLMRANEAGSTPPQESGLVNNGWFGRFHMEMYWWHAAHWALWNKWTELDRSLGIYDRFLPMAKARAKSEGYLGSRWQKCTAPDGREWPHIIHSLLLWQQPHPLFFAELDYRAHPTKETLAKWAPIVRNSADFLASYAWLNPATKKYDLGPPLIVASENNDPHTAKNPTFELAYWRFGLRIADEWAKRMGEKPNPLWAKVRADLAPLPQEDGLYVLYEGVPDMWTKFNFEHPALTASYGLLPGDGVEPDAMRNTLEKIKKVWNFDRTWGWDYPMLAMCSARLGNPSQAVDFLLTDKPGFQFDHLGLATGGPYPYFPSNGGLLYAVAMMAAGWDGAHGEAPGFPSDGTWKVRTEGLSLAP